MKRDTRRYLLIEACEWGDLEALKQLLDLEQGHDDVTPRRRYRADSHVPLPSLLAGANRIAQDVSGRTPFDLCREAHPRAYEVLRGFARLLPPPRAILDYMEKVEIRGFENAAPLQQASSSGGCIGSILEGKIRDTLAHRRKRGGWFGRRERQRDIVSGVLNGRSKRR